jgi:hypothetical protein
MQRVIAFAAVFLFVSLSFADGPEDNKPDKVRPVPPLGIVVPQKVSAELTAGLLKLRADIDDLRASLAKKLQLLEMLPDVEIYYNSVAYALKYNEFYSEKEFEVARKHLKQGHERAASLREGKTPWNSETGLVVRGYKSKIDGSIQPYGLVVPKTYNPDLPLQYRLDLWFHGRGEKLTELNFIEGRQKDPGQFTPANAFVLHPYGRYCNANHFAGEIDTFEALDHARKHYPIDENRISVRGFSMGGAACWNFAVHYPGLWAAAAPGAGFSETPEFLRVFQKETIKPNDWQKKLLHWYDCTDWAGNLYNVPTVAYSGELDSQKQAADIMGDAMSREQLQLMHIIGPKTGHSYHPDAKAEINRRIDSIVAKGRSPLPRKLHLTTYTLRYNNVRWLTVDSIAEHWERADISAEIFEGKTPRNVVVRTKNVTSFTLSIPPGHCPFDNRPKGVVVFIDGQSVPWVPVQSDRSWTSHYRKADGQWALFVDPGADDAKLRKRHKLQGPIDDAFMDTLVMVRQTKRPVNEYAKLYNWIDKEMEHAVDHWRKQFRGELKVIDSDQVDDKVIANSNLVLWGDRHTNPIIAKIADKLPIRWEARKDAPDSLRLAEQKFDATRHLPVLIYPNPLNPKKYVVLNSGFTFREYDYLNNARQIPRLPDWAILDIDQPRTSQRPAGIVEAGFFGERWELVGKK